MAINKNLSIFRSFHHRNYALYFCGQSLSLIGTWMQRTGISWMVYATTGSAFMLGITIFATQFPSFLFSLLGGIISDRYNRHKILFFTQTASLLQAALLAILTLSHHYTISVIILLSIVLGIINAFDLPARQPLVHELVTDKSDLPNALALNSAMVNLARLLGPALAGFVLMKFGAGICFLLNAVSFLAVLTSLFLMKLPAWQSTRVKKKMNSELVEGFRYLKQNPSIAMILLMLTLVSLLVLPYDTLLPVFAKVIFKGDAATFGYISSFMGLGAIGGTLFLASLKKGTNLKIVLLFNTLILGTGLILLSHMRFFPVAMLFAVITGFGAISQNTICITLLQVNTAASMRGRVMSFLAMGFFGMLPLGSLLVGYSSQHVGAPNTMLCQGIIAIILAFVFSKFLRKEALNTKERAGMEEAEDLLMKTM